MKANGKFYQWIVDSQDYASDDEHMVSMVSFVLEVNGREYDLKSFVKQTIGSKFEECCIEVCPPDDYNGPFNHGEFSKAVFRYYTSLIGPNGRVMQIENCSDFSLRDVNFRYEMPFTLNINSSEGGW